MARLVDLFNRLVRLYQKEIWQPALLRDRSPRGWVYAALRVISITWTVFNETKAASRAAALSYSSLLGLGPLLAIAMLVAGFMLDTKDPDLAVDSLNRLIKFVAPQVVQFEQLQAVDVTDPEATLAPASGPKVAVNQDLVNFMNGIISGSRSGAAGALGAFSLIFIVLMLFTSVENTFNEIWGVRRGRSWMTRVVYYWTIVTLGAVLFFASITALGAGAFVNVFNGLITQLPHGAELLAVVSWALPAFSVAMLVFILTLFYRFVPNTHVFWRAALVGAIVVTALIFLNNLAAFFYFRRVLQTRSLYGPVAIAVILMLGFYIFWLFVLIGGQVSYAVQNVHFRNSQAAWGQLAESMRERLSLIVLLTIARRFHECLSPCTASQLGDMLRVPTQIINECLNRLIDMQLVVATPPAPGANATDFRYQPARPLHRITLQQFKRLDDTYGDDPTGDTLMRLDPVLRHYENELDVATASEFFTKPLDRLITEMPLDESRPPFATMTSR
ncbi:MAG: YihY/virulence factor BrkB family protein [Opitutae bacterium]|nr:YihY/virulence factor BrkB family protein [Opitutae bacterium]